MIFHGTFTDPDGTGKWERWENGGRNSKGGSKSSWPPASSPHHSSSSPYEKLLSSSATSYENVPPILDNRPSSSVRYKVPNPPSSIGHYHHRGNHHSHHQHKLLNFNFPSLVFKKKKPSSTYLGGESFSHSDSVLSKVGGSVPINIEDNGDDGLLFLQKAQTHLDASKPSYLGSKPVYNNQPHYLRPLTTAPKKSRLPFNFIPTKPQYYPNPETSFHFLSNKSTSHNRGNGGHRKPHHRHKHKGIFYDFGVNLI